MNTWREEVARFVSNPYNPYEITPDSMPPPSGHSDFAHNDRFDWTKEDKGWTRPEIPWIGTRWHFKPYFESVRDVMNAITECNENRFERLCTGFKTHHFTMMKDTEQFWGTPQLLSVG